jgi:hypothetical protein
VDEHGDDVVVSRDVKKVNLVAFSMVHSQESPSWCLMHAGRDGAVALTPLQQHQQLREDSMHEA